MKKAIFSFTPAGEHALLVSISAQSIQCLQQRNDELAALVTALENQSQPWLLDLVPSFETLLVFFDTELIDHYALINYLKSLRLDSSKQEGREHRLPIFFDKPSTEMPLDLDRLSAHSDLSKTDLINDLCKPHYRVYAIGFLPNFAYVGEVNPSFALPRLSTPRDKVPEGAFALADRQLAIYPKLSPGGWNVLGYCPLSKHFGKSIHFKVGDTVSYYPCEFDEYQRCLADV